MWHRGLICACPSLSAATANKPPVSKQGRAKMEVLALMRNWHFPDSSDLCSCLNPVDRRRRFRRRRQPNPPTLCPARRFKRQSSITLRGVRFYRLLCVKRYKYTESSVLIKQ
eukprot:2903721-Pleurochrysis_carterae.AAC.8